MTRFGQIAFWIENLDRPTALKVEAALPDEPEPVSAIARRAGLVRHRHRAPRHGRDTIEPYSSVYYVLDALAEAGRATLETRGSRRYYKRREES